MLNAVPTTFLQFLTVIFSNQKGHFKIRLTAYRSRLA